MSLTTLFTNIANAIRNKKGTTAPIKASDFASEIESIQTSGGETPGGSSDNKLTLLLANQLEEVTAEDIGNITQIPLYAFYYKTGIKKVTLPSTITEIRANAFDQCMYLSEINLESSPNLTTIGTNAFTNTYIENVNISRNITFLGDYAFSGCRALKIANVDINSSAKLGTYLFQNCSNLQMVNFGDEITTLPKYICGSCSYLTNVHFPNNLQKIDNYAFSQCVQLAEIDLPATITQLGSGAFQYCTGLRTIYCRAITPPSITASVFPDNVERVYIPTGSLASYQGNSYWNNKFANKFIEIDM